MSGIGDFYVEGGERMKRVIAYHLYSKSEVLEFIKQNNLDDFKTLYTEGSFTVRDAEVQFNLGIGKIMTLVDDVEPYAKVIKRHSSYLKECIEVYKQWASLEGQYTKDLSWSDLCKLAGIVKEKRPRKALKKVIEERKAIYEAKLLTNSDPETYGRLREDVELLKEDKCES